MRYFIFLAFVGLLLSSAVRPAAAQQAEQTVKGQLSWTGYAQTLKSSGKLEQVPTFYGAVFRPGEEAGRYLLRIQGKVAEGQLRNAVYAPLPAADARRFNLTNLAATAPVVLSSGVERRQPVTLAAVLSVRRNAQTGQPEKLISFDYTYSLSSAPTAVAARGIMSRTHASSSVLSQGDWFKIGVPEGGMYKLDKSFLQSLGLNLQGLDPRKLRLYGNAMGTLPQRNDAYRPDDLVENPVLVAGEADGSFDDNDYLLFYARGPHTWSSDASTKLFRHKQNVYTDTAYYFLTVGTAAGRRVAAAPAPTAAPSATISQYAYHGYHEYDLINLLKSGREWLGEGFASTTAGTTRDFSFTIPDLVTGSALRVTSFTAANSAIGVYTRFNMAVNGTTVGSQIISGLTPPADYPEAANTDLATFSYAVPANAPATTKITLTYSGGNDPSAQGWLDYLEVNAQRQLRLVDNQIDFRSFDNIAPGAASTFVLSAPAGTMVWEVTNPRRPRAFALDAAGRFTAPTDSLREFVAFTGGNRPFAFGRVGRQNLHELNLDGRLDMVIVTYPPFFGQAQRLADYRLKHDGLVCRVVTTSQVYNEFSSGGQDVTAIRDLMKMVYDRAPAGKSLFLLLFGDASYDYKSDAANGALPDWWKSRSPLNGDQINQNYVPTYQSRESLAKAYSRPYSNPRGYGPSYNSDDYYGLLDDREGFWNENLVYSPDSVTELMDIGIGRLPIRTPRGQPNNTDQAVMVVNKLIAYDDTASYGKWRNRITFVADDGNGNYHVNVSTNPVADSLTSRHPEFNAHKVYLDLYPQVIASGGQRSPDCNRAIDEAIEQGSLIVQYSGHGGPKGWADEQILTNGTVLKLQNRNKLTFMLTGTCDFSTFDDPEQDSAGEQALTDIQGGAVGLLTTTRLAFTSTNDAAVKAFYASLFTPVDGQPPRLGTLMMDTYNNSAALENRNFALLGDPSMRLAIPQQQVTLDSVNGVALTAANPQTLQALSVVTMAGQVRSGGVVNTAFNGKAQLTIYEKPNVVSTLGNEDPKVTVAIQENIIYSGQASVRNGRYRVRFVVPKDINYSLGLGKVSLYASNSNHQDANGARAIPIGGANPTAARDTIAPDIRLFMDDTTFVFGGLTGVQTKLMARLRDQSGINTAGSGIGHEITATLDNDPSKLIILNDFYTASVDNFQKGQVEYLFKDLSTGPHLLRLKAWDTFNNSAEKEIEFIAASTEKLALEHVLNYPNPFSTTTTFHFDHNRAQDDLDVQVQIFTISGRLVRTLRASTLGADPHFKDLSWNGRDEYDDQLARGVYVYRVSVKSQRDGSTASKFEKLVILN